MIIKRLLNWVCGTTAKKQERSQEQFDYCRISKGRCPACTEPTRFLAGPRGGMSQNIKCEKCGQRFNITPAMGIAEYL